MISRLEGRKDLGA